MGSSRWQSKTHQRGCGGIDRVSEAYGKPVGEGGGLGGGRQRNRRRKASLHGLDGLESRTTPKSLVEVKSQSAGGHCGQLEWVGGGKGDGEKSWSRPEVEVRKSNCSPSSPANHMTRFSKPSRLLPCRCLSTLMPSFPSFRVKAAISMVHLPTRLVPIRHISIHCQLTHLSRFRHYPSVRDRSYHTNRLANCRMFSDMEISAENPSLNALSVEN